MRSVGQAEGASFLVRKCAVAASSKSWSSLAAQKRGTHRLLDRSSTSRASLMQVIALYTVYNGPENSPGCVRRNHGSSRQRTLST